MRPTPITDFTNDPRRIQATIDLMLRNYPAFRDVNLFDALKFTLIGGKGDAVVLDKSKADTAEYGGLVDIQGRRKAIILIASGLDTFSKINYDKARKIAQNAGIPIYIIGTLNFFMKKYGDRVPTPITLSFLSLFSKSLFNSSSSRTCAEDSSARSSERPLRHAMTSTRRPRPLMNLTVSR